MAGRIDCEIARAVRLLRHPFSPRGLRRARGCGVNWRTAGQMASKRGRIKAGGGAQKTPDKKPGRGRSAIVRPVGSTTAISAQSSSPAAILMFADNVAISKSPLYQSS